MGSDYREHYHERRAPYAERAAQVVRFVDEFTRANGYSPTMREIRDAIGVAAVSTAHTVVQRLIEEGRLSGRPGTGRTIRVNHATLPAEGETLGVDTDWHGEWDGRDVD